MEPKAPEAFPYPAGPQGPVDTAEKLRLESSQLLGTRTSRQGNDTAGDTASNAAASGRRKPLNSSNEIASTDRSSPMKGLKDDNYTVSLGDSLTSIAQRMLKLRGEKPTARDIYDEVNRIVDLNTEKYPWLAKNPNKIRAGMIIQVWDKETGPDPTCRWKDWKEAEADRINVALRCESIFAGKGTQVVVTPGARAVFTDSSHGFVAPKGFARVLAGSHVMAVGGEVIDAGGDLQVLHAGVKVRTDHLAKASRKEIAAAQQSPAPREASVSQAGGSADNLETIEVPPI